MIKGKEAQRPELNEPALASAMASGAQFKDPREMQNKPSAGHSQSKISPAVTPGSLRGPDAQHVPIFQLIARGDPAGRGPGVLRDQDAGQGAALKS